MRVPHLLGQLIVTFALAALIVPLAVALLPAERDHRVGYLTVACVFAGVFGVLRVVWRRPRS
jgi:hypothetical protein